jgi:hypothetical protein
MPLAVGNRWRIDCHQAAAAGALIDVQTFVDGITRSL